MSLEEDDDIPTLSDDVLALTKMFLDHTDDEEENDEPEAIVLKTEVITRSEGNEDIKISTMVSQHPLWGHTIWNSSRLVAEMVRFWFCQFRNFHFLYPLLVD